MRKIDMHLHTCASDGSFTPQEAAEEAKKKKMDFVCISDHDTVESSIEFIRMAKEFGIGSIPAMEATTTLRGVEYHILGYNVDLYSSLTDDFIRQTAEVRNQREYDIMREAVKMYDCLSMDEFLNYDRPYDLGGFPTLNYMKYKGIVNSYPEYAKIKEKMDLPEYCYWSSGETIEMYRKTGAFVVLAHPSYHYRGGVMDEKQLDEFREMGINGVECYSPYNAREEQIEYYKKYCKEHDLAVSGGSDCHGPYLTRDMGVPYVTDETSDILEYLGL